MVICICLMEIAKKMGLFNGIICFVIISKARFCALLTLIITKNLQIFSLLNSTISSSKLVKAKTTRNSNINFVRWLTKSTLLRPAKEGDAENSGDADFFVNLNKKKWSKQLKHISNQVAHIMKGSSYFLNYTSHIINIFAKEAEKLGMMKKRGMQFSSELFLRHK